jgi:hypothetical protein
MIQEEKREAAKQQMIAAAFIGWQQRADGKTSFQKYLYEYGLAEPEAPLTAKQKAALTKQALDNVDKALRAFKRKKRRKK